MVTYGVLKRMSMIKNFLMRVPQAPMTVSWGLLWMRLVFGGTMVVAHGWAKLTNFTEIATRFPDPFGVGSQISLSLAVFAEVFCATALVGGILTRLVLLPLIITMAVAFFVIHGADPWMKKELAFLYLNAYIILFIAGPGRISFDGQGR